MVAWLHNATWITTQGRLVRGAIEIVGDRLRPLPGGAPPTGLTDGVLDLTGKLVLPGVVDPHVHFRQPGGARKEGIANGSRAALAGGVTTICEMPNSAPPTSTPARFAEKRRLFQRHCRVHWGVHLHADPARRQDVPETAASLKIYMAKSSGLPAVTSIDALARLFTRYHRVAVHAEDETAFLPAEDGVPPTLSHHRVRPVASVTAALDKLRQALLRLSREERPRLILCHMGTADEVTWLARMKNDHFDVWGETCPHYYLLDTTDVARLGSMAKVNPPIREPHHREAILEGLRSGTIDFLATDHAPHLPEAKAQAANPPSGIAGLEVFAPAAMLLADRFGFPIERMPALTSANACRCFGIAERGAIEEGYLADLVVLGPPESRPPHGVITRAGVHPYVDQSFTRSVFATFVAGQPAYRAGRFMPAVRGREVFAT